MKKMFKRAVILSSVFLLLFTLIGITNFNHEMPLVLASNNTSKTINAQNVIKKTKQVTIASNTVSQNVYEKDSLPINTVTEVVYQVDPTVADNVYGNNTKSVLIRLKKTTDSVTFSNKKLSKKNLKKLKNTNTLVVDLNSTEIKKMQADKEVAFVEVDSPVEAVTKGKVIPLEAKVNKKNPTAQLVPWGISSIGADLTMNDHKEGKAIKIAVLDTGITNLADLNVQDGVSFVDGITDYADDNGHGTHVAGTIAALNNQTGVVGAASKARIYAVKVLDKNGSGSYGQVIEGIEWAIENKMDIISISFGGTRLSQALHDAIIEANNKGILIISAAGNAGKGVETENYPALFPEVISVGAVDTKFNRSWFSSTGAEIDLVAPGSLILSTLKEGGYGYLSGTSMAVPHVVGAAAVLWSENKTWTSEQIKQKLYDTATLLGDVHEYGHGLVNVAKALDIINTSIARPVNPLIPLDSQDNVNLPNKGSGEVEITSADELMQFEVEGITINKIGDWWQENGTYYSGGIALITNVVGSKLTTTFVGNSLIVIASPGPNRGRASVLIDGVTYPDIDLYNIDYSAGVPYTIATGLSSGYHSLEITENGNKNSSSSGNYLVIDSFKAQNTTQFALQTQEAEGTLISKSGFWFPDGTTAIYSNNAGSKMISTFVGTMVTILAILGPNRGIANIKIDGIVYPVIDLYQSYYSSQQYVVAQGLLNTTHTLEINVSVNKNVSATDYYIVIDAVKYIGGKDDLIPSTPSNLIVLNKTDTSTSLNWTPSTDNIGVTGYDIYRASTLIASTSSVTTTTLITGLTSNTTYNFSVKAKDGAENFSKSSNILFVTTNPGSPEADDINTGAIPIGYDLTYTAYIGTASDVDFYKYTATGNGIEQLTMSVPLDKNYDVYVYDSIMNLVDTGIRGLGLSEEAIFKVNGGATYYIKIFGANGDYGMTPYSFNLTRDLIKYQTDYQYDNNGNLQHKITKSIQN